MNTFADNLVNASIRTTTQNGCATYETTLNANLDFFSQASSMRGKYHLLTKLFQNAWDEDNVLAIRNLFYLRDIRGGQGERSSFRYILKYIVSKLSVSEYTSIISFIPVYGRWDDLLSILQYMISKPEEYKDQIDITMRLLQKQLIKDMEDCEKSKSISLLAKWFPLENNTKNTRKKKFAKYLSYNFFHSSKECRLTIVKLRNHLNVTEQLTSSNNWDSINYSFVPSKANLKYRNAFMKHDKERYEEYLSKVSSGKEKINTQTVYPYEIVKKVLLYGENTNQLEALWNNLPNYINENSSIVVVDASGSMYSSCNSSARPIDIALSLGLYYAERNDGPFKNIFFTFSEHPTIQQIKGNTLYQKIHNLKNSQWGMNTNIVSVFELYLQLAKESKIEDLPKNIIIVSDMEFDYCVKNYTSFEYIKKMFKKESIPMPTLIFWNVNSSGKNVPVKFNETGVILVSGFSPSILRYVMEGKTPIQFMLDVLMSERYNIIDFSKN